MLRWSALEQTPATTLFAQIRTRLCQARPHIISPALEGVGLGYQFVVDEKGVATSVVEIKVNGPITYTRLK